MSMEFWKEGLFLFTNNRVIWSKSGYYAHNHILLLTNSNYIINYTGQYIAVSIFFVWSL